MMASFVSIVAAPAVQQVAEKRLFGGPYIRLGRLFIVVGTWLFQQGGALGYGLRQHPGILSKLLGADPQLSPNDVLEAWRERAAAVLAEADAEEKDFHQLFVVPKLRRLGIEISSWPPSKGLDKKLEQREISNVMVNSFAEGAAIGYHFPDSFRAYWENNYGKRSDSEWQGWRKQGLILSEVQQDRPLAGAVAELAAPLSSGRPQRLPVPSTNMNCSA